MIFYAQSDQKRSLKNRLNIIISYDSLIIFIIYYMRMLYFIVYVTHSMVVRLMVNIRF